MFDEIVPLPVHMAPRKYLKNICPAMNRPGKISWEKDPAEFETTTVIQS